MKTKQEMTKDDIKKALQCCSGIRIYCNDCPYDAVGNCNDTLSADALNLIIEQEKEIERLKAENYELTKKLEARLTCDFVKTAQKQAQIDILKKAKERFNAISRELGDDCDLCGVSAVCWCRCEIDELIKEVQNE